MATHQWLNAPILNAPMATHLWLCTYMAKHTNDYAPMATH
jgi:hypothetical protein